MVMIRFGEISIKGEYSRRRMEKRLLKNIREVLNNNNIHAFIYSSRGRIWVCCFESEEKSLSISNILTYVMGIVSLSPVFRISFNSLEELNNSATKFFSNRVKDKVYAVRVRRVGIHNFTSKDVEKIVGASLIRYGTKVDLEDPEYIAYIEIRDNYAYLYDKIIKGPGGLPLGSEGKVLSLFSGGIDSPVATWFILKRGCIADLVLFNIGGDRQIWSVAMVAKVLADRWFYGYKPKMYVIDVRPLIARIVTVAPEGYIVILLRRFMNKIAERLAQHIGALALVTGESLGQVASQTLDNLSVIEEVVKIPILRPLIGMDKDEITAMARKIGTYEYSIRVEEYCSLGARVTLPRVDSTKVREYEDKIGLTYEEIDKMINDSIILDLKSLELEYIKNKLESLGLNTIHRKT